MSNEKNNTDPVRALISAMTDYLDQEIEPELDVIERWRDQLEAALASAPSQTDSKQPSPPSSREADMRDEELEDRNG